MGPWRDFHLSISEDQSSGCYPPILQILRVADQAAAFNARYRLRKPAGIYTASLGRVFHAVIETADSLEKLKGTMTREQPHGSGELWESALASQERLLYRIMEHLDDCNNILKTFFPDKESFNKDRRTRSFRKSIHSYRNHVALIVNTIKHNQGQVRAISMNRGNRIVPGYFIETFRSDGGLGPDENIHRNQGAFSFPRDIRLHFSHIYFVADRLGEVLKVLSDVPRKVQDAHVSSDGKAPIDIARRLLGCPEVVFPDEVRLSQPFVSLARMASKCTRLIVSFSRRSDVKTFSNCQVVSAFKGDGSTDSFKIPYWNRPNMQT